MFEAHFYYRNRIIDVFSVFTIVSQWVGDVFGKRFLARKYPKCGHRPQGYILCGYGENVGLKVST